MENVRKIIVLLVMVVLVLFLAGCNKEETKKETDATNVTQPETKTEEKTTTESSTEATDGDKSETSDQTEESAGATSDADETEDVEEKESATFTNASSTDSNTTTEVKAEEKKPGCTDSDNGKDYNTAGSITLKTGYKESDACSTNPNTPKKLYEKYCKGDVYLTEGYECEYGCNTGACVAEGSVNEEDTDESTNVSNETAEAPANSTK